MRHPRAFCEGGSLVEFGFPDSTAAGGLPGSWVEGAGPGGTGSGSVGAEERHMCFSRIKGNIQLLVEDADTADQGQDHTEAWWERDGAWSPAAAS